MSAYWKDIFRTIKYGRKRFFSILLIVALGVTMFTGIRAACRDLTITADDFFDQQHLYDVNVASTLGLTEADVKALTSVEGVAAAEGGYELSVYTMIEGGEREAAAKMIGDQLNHPYVLEGELPKAPDEVAVNEMYVKHSGKSVGDTLVMTEEEIEEQDPFLAGTEYVITAVINDPMDINMRDGNVSWRSQGTVDYTFYLDRSAFSSDIFTYIYLSVADAAALDTYSDAYSSKVGTVVDVIAHEVKESREQARYEQIVSDAWEEYNEAEAEVLAELAEAEAELADGKAELADAERELTEARGQLADARTELEKGEKELADGQLKLEEGKAELANQEALLNSEMEKAWAEIASGKQQIADARLLLDTQEADLQTKQTELTALQVTKTDLETKLAGLSAVGAEEPSHPYHSFYLEVQDGLASINAAVPDLPGALTQVQAGLDQISTARSTLAGEEQTLLAGEQELIRQESTARQQLTDAKAVLTENESALYHASLDVQDGWTEYNKGIAEVESGYQEYLEGVTEYEDGLTEYEDGYEEAMTELAEARTEIEDIEEGEWYIQTRSSLSGYANVQSDADSIEGIGAFLAIIFFVVAVLISLTTITRMVEEDRGMIGTYKALGFTTGEIRRKAVIFSIGACIAGGILGDIGGFVILPKIIIYIFTTMYTFPEFSLHFDWIYGTLGIVLFVAGVAGAAAVSSNHILRQMPAQLMRPVAPMHGSRIFLERIPALWSKMSFLNKVTARNLFRYKKRFFMTVFGIMGCTALLVCGFGIKNTVTDFMPKQYEQTYVYDIMAVTLPEDYEELISYVDDPENIESYLSVQVETMKLKNEAGREETVQMIVVPDGQDIDPYIHLRLQDGSIVPLTDDGITITRNVSEVLQFTEQDRILMRDIAYTEVDACVSQIVENYLGNMIYVTESYYEEHFKEFAANGALVNLKENCADPVGYAENLGEQEGIISCISTENLKEDFSSAFALMNLVVYVVIVLAAGLAFVVLFTLATTNISERNRELATIKVLGFYDKEVHLYVNKETLILSVIGILIGLPVGACLVYALGVILNLPGIYFDVSIFPISYLISAVIAFAFALIVNQITNRLLDVIDPVEALKSVE